MSAIQKATVFQEVDAGVIPSPEVMKNLEAALETDSGRRHLEGNSGIFGFIENSPLPKSDLAAFCIPESTRKLKQWDARQAYLLRLLLEKGGSKQLDPMVVGKEQASKLLGIMLGASALTGGSQTVKTVAEFGGDVRASQDLLDAAFLIASARCWLFPELVPVLLELGATGNAPSSATNAAPPVVIMAEIARQIQNAAVNDQRVNQTEVGTAMENLKASLSLTLAKSKSVPKDAMSLAITAGWVEGVEAFLTADPRQDAAQLDETLSNARLQTPGYPEEAASRIKHLISGVSRKQTESLASLPKLRIYFVSRTEQHGEEPWVTDGTPAGTRMLADVNPGRKGSAPKILEGIASGLVLRGLTEGGVERLLVLHPDRSVPVELGETGTLLPKGSIQSGNLLILVDNNSRLWQTDGSPAGTVGVALEKLRVESATGFKGKALIKASDGKRTSYLLDPQNRKLKPIFSDPKGWINTRSRVIWNNRIYSTTREGILVKSPKFDEGGGATAEAVPELVMEKKLRVSFESGAAIMGDYLYFTGKVLKEVAKGRYAETCGWELYRTKGDFEETQMVADLREDLQDELGSKPGSYMGLKNKVLFLADDGKNGRRLWCFDGESTRMLHQTLVPDNSFMVRKGDTVFFIVNTKEIWATDGTPGGTRPFRAFDGEIHGFSTVGDSIIWGVSGSNSVQLWRSDGTSEGTVNFAQVPDLIKNPNGQVFWSADIADAPKLNIPAASVPKSDNESLPEKKFVPVPID